MSDIEHQEYIKAARALGLGDITMHHRKLSEEPLSKEDWAEVYRATLAYQFHLQIITARARARKVVQRWQKISSGGGRSLKEVSCLVCGHHLKRRRYRKSGMGPTCARKLAEGYTGIQLKAWEPAPELVTKRG
jgi:hypothetical protein